jgi:hypothetical protein
LNIVNMAQYHQLLFYNLEIYIDAYANLSVSFLW